MKVFLSAWTLILACLAQAQTATEIVRQADEKLRGSTSQAQIVIQTVRPSWTREMTVKTWLKGTDFAIILVQSPPRDKGIVYLKRKKEVWNWIPAIEKVIKLPPSMMAQSWMGTDFTNDDLVKESSVVIDYTHSIIGDSLINGRSCYKILLSPKPEAAVVWGKLIVYIDKTEYLELYCLFYDEDGKLVNTMVASDIKTMDGRMIPTRFEMVPADKPGQKTVMTYKYILFNRPLDERFFTTERLKSITD